MSTLYITITVTTVEWQIGTMPTERIQHCGDVEHVIAIIQKLKQEQQPDITVIAVE